MNLWDDHVDKFKRSIREAADRNLLESQPRMMFVSDDDGHNYLIPADKKRAFEDWVEASQDDREGDYLGESFDDCMISGPISSYTFTNPQEGK